MLRTDRNRRQFLKASAAAATVPYFLSRTSLADEAKSDSPSDRPLVGCIGTGSRWNAVGGNAMKFGDVVAVCDVDARHLGAAQAKVEERQGNKPEGHEDYQRILDRKDVEIVTIVTPDHWHTKIAIEAMQAGKDVYCEKPLTLTIDEGKQIIRAMEQTGRVFQVGTQQRSEMGGRFLTAVAIAHSGRLGEIKKVTCGINGAPTCDPIPVVEVPQGLNWEKWQGQAPLAEFRFREGGRWGNTRCHYEFRWWYEYSGGKMTDWGAHHVDIAQWAIRMDHSGPTKVEPLRAEHPVPLDDAGMPTDPSRYNVAHQFDVRALFPGDIEMLITSEGDNGILIEGTEGRIFVNRGKITGAPVEALESDPLPEDAITRLYKGKQPGDHMRNFFECVKTREQPVSDVYTHHRAMTTCHLANIAMRLGREVTWDADRQQIVGDEQAQGMQRREQREGYEIEV